MQLDGLHHLTAITGDPRRNLEFYTGLLGLRLVAKTVSPEDLRVYTLVYGAEHGQAGAGLVFLGYPGAPLGRAGTGMVHRIVWRVASPSAIEFWHGRLLAAGIDVDTCLGGGIRFEDFEGLGHELALDTGHDEPLIAMHPEIPVTHALRGLDGIRAYAHTSTTACTLLEKTLRATRQADHWELRGKSRGGWLALDPPPPVRGRRTAGTVHNVAWTTGAGEQPLWAGRLRKAGVPTTGIVERYLFRSLYFGGPGEIVFDLATDTSLPTRRPTTRGEQLTLPPWLEPTRCEIEKALPQLPDSRAGWPERLVSLATRRDASPNAPA